MQAMKTKDVEAKLREQGCTIARQGGKHTVWQCGCDQNHTAAVPRHREVSPGVVRDIIRKLPCLSKGWLQ